MALENATLQTSQALHELQKFLTASVPPIALESQAALDGPLQLSASDLPGLGLPMSGDFHEFNEKKLGPFTEYPKFQRGCRGIFCRNLSLLSPGPSSQFQQRRCIPRRARHSSCSACPTKRNDDADKRSQRPEPRVKFSLDVDRGSNVRSNSTICRGFAGGGRDAGDGRPRGFCRPHTIGTDLLQIPGRISLLTSPLSPIITPIRTEYTSITDDIDTASVTHRSPPSTPTVHPWVYQAEGKRKKAGAAAAGRKRKRPLPNDQLKKAEETVHKQMEFIVHKRIRQLSLTETESTGNLAKHALESLEDGSEEEGEETGVLPLHHSDDETTTSGVAAGGAEGGLKPIKSEPVLKKHHQRHATGGDRRASEFEVIVDVHEDRADSGISERTVASEAAISFNFGGDGTLGHGCEDLASLANKRPSSDIDSTVSFTVGKDRPSPTIPLNTDSTSSC